MVQTSIHEKNTALLKRVKEGDASAEAELLEQNMGLVRTVAKRFVDRGTELEDLIQIGSIGIVKAIRSFSLERGTAFSTYAVPLIVGEIRRHLRDDGPIKVSRIYKRQGVAILKEKNRIMTEEGREAGIVELAERCGMSVEDAATALDAVSPVTSLSEYVYGEDSVTFEGVLADEESEAESERICDRVAIAQCLSRLSPLWRKLILLRYYRNMTQQQTAELLGLTQVKVSREEKKILLYLKEELS